jgi:hypothetical protein
VLSHLDYISALTGVEPSGVGEMGENEAIVDQLLRLVTGVEPTSRGNALEAESGTWDPVTRVRMLQLRFFSKLTLMDTDSTHFRAMCLSKRYSDPSRGGGRLRYFTWFDGVIAAAKHFDVPTHDPARFDDVVNLPFSSNLLQPSRSLIRFERFDAASDNWNTVDADTLDLANQCLRVRAVHDGAIRFDYSTGESVSSWGFPSGTRIKQAFALWSVQVREATFAELRLRGNHVRQALFNVSLQEWANNESGQRDYAPLKVASYLEPYWFATDPHAARCLLRARLGYSKLEFDYRRAHHHYPRASASSGLEAQALGHIRETVMRRLARPHDRACYLCPVSEWLPETVSHTLQSCSHPQLVRERERLAAALTDLIDSSAQLPDCPPPPSIDNASSLHYLMLLATSVGPTDHRKLAEQHHDAQASQDGAGLRRSERLAQRLTFATHESGAPSAAALADRRQRCQWLPLQRDQASLAVSWLTFLTSSWRRAIACERESELAAQLGASLVSLVVTYHRQVINIRRRLLQADVSYLRRCRDPAAPHPAIAAVT